MASDPLNLAIARGPGIVDFSPIGGLLGDYWKGLDARHIQDQRNAFKEGLPRDEAGNVDYGKILETTLQLGGTPSAKEAANIDLQRQGLAALQGQNSALFGSGGPQTVLPPSTSRVNGTLPGAPQAGGRYSGGDNGESSVAAIVGGKMPADHPQAGVIIGNIAKTIGADPNQPLTPEQLDRATRLVDAYTARTSAPNGVAVAPVPGTAPAAQPPVQNVPTSVGNATFAQRFPTQAGVPFRTNPAAPVGPAAAPQADPTMGGLIPSQFAGDPQKYISALQAAAVNAGAAGFKESAKAYLDRADAVQKAIGQYRESGLQERREMTTAGGKQVLERLGTGQEKASSIADGILVSHDLLAQLDARAGIFSGQWSDAQLSLAKAGKAIGDAGGFKVDEARITNTEAFQALVGKKVAQTVKSFGSGTSITNQDREYAAKMEAGDIKLDETSMRRILMLTDKINRETINKHNRQVDAFLKSRPELAGMRPNLIVEQPPPYVAPKVTAPAAIKDGQTATNPKTGEKIQFLNGKWAPIPGPANQL
jgi:hypothetical protein